MLDEKGIVGMRVTRMKKLLDYPEGYFVDYGGNNEDGADYAVSCRRMFKVV